jgi:hypothetical protein
MAIRTNHKMVEDVLQQCWDDTTKLDRYIKAASLIVDRVETCAISRDKALTASELKEIETWLAAHFYTKMDPTYTSRSTDGASGSFVRDPKVPEPFKDGALMLDYSGCLVAILEKRRVSVGWMGRPPSEQTDYIDRD